jgi:signal transduction histidine kinase
MIGSQFATRIAWKTWLSSLGVASIVFIFYSVFEFIGISSKRTHHILSAFESVSQIPSQFYIMGDFLSMKNFLEDWAGKNNVSLQLLDSNGVFILNIQNRHKDPIIISGNWTRGSANLGTFTITGDLYDEKKSKLNSFLIQFCILQFGFLLYLILQVFVTKKAISPLKELETELYSEARRLGLNSNIFDNDELINLRKLFDHITNAWIIERNLVKESERMTAFVDISQQVSHDIRSPLSALNMMLTDLKELPEQKRIIVRSAIQRINDISNTLLDKSKKIDTFKTSLDPKIENLTTPPFVSRILLTSLVGELLSEKRLQFREKINISIEENFNNAYGYFVDVNPTELKRVISNLINNSIEAFSNNSGSVVVETLGTDKFVSLTISDNGCGIPNTILSKLGSRGFTYGKNNSSSGSGLGIYHAKTTIENLGGTFEIKSSEGCGTIIHIQLPRVPAPQWFVEKISLSPGITILSIDDDQSIHSLWKGRLNNVLFQRLNIKLLCFTSAKDFIQKHNRLIPTNQSNILYLVDYEFIDQGINGLELIEKLETASNSILVTSRYEDPSIQEKCRILGVKLIPKALSGFVPIEITP